MSLIEDKTCVHCETDCLPCKEKRRAEQDDTVTIPREFALKLFNLCVRDEVRMEFSKYL